MSCLMTRAENSWAARHEREEQALECDRQRLYDEFMQALSCPLVGHVTTSKGRRYPVIECLFENLAWGKFNAQAAQAIAILMRDPAGRAICEQMAAQHANDYAEGSDE